MNLIFGLREIMVGVICFFFFFFSLFLSFSDFFEISLFILQNMNNNKKY